ncbi:MAG: hypothetical protein WCA37_04460 [Terracidiphilus sp.]
MRLRTMKLAFRIFAFAVVVAGAAAAATSNSNSHAIANHLSATSALPVPTCNMCR